jgi:hypothetical protein
MEQAREHLAELTNQTLLRNGRDERVDHRSYARQGVDREPGRHYGPAAAHMVGRGMWHERLEAELDRGDVWARVASLDRGSRPPPARAFEEGAEAASDTMASRGKNSGRRDDQAPPTGRKTRVLRGRHAHRH